MGRSKTLSSVITTPYTSSILRTGERRRVPFLAPPAPSQALVGRDEILQKLKSRLFQGGPLGIGALDGLPGIGKTAVAVALANDKEVLSTFSDGVLWAGLGKQGDVMTALASWGEVLGVSIADLGKAKTVESRARLVHSAIGLQRLLLVVDDAWSVPDSLAFRLGGPNCGHIVTTRLPEVASEFAGSGAFVLPELDVEQSRALLNDFLPTIPSSAVEEVNRALCALGGLPLSVVLLGVSLRRAAMVGEHRIKELLRDVLNPSARVALERSLGPLDMHPSLPKKASVSLGGIIQISYDDLRPVERTCFRRLAYFPPKPNTFSRAAALAVGASERATFDQLIERRLVERIRDDRCSLHQSLWDFASTVEREKQDSSEFINFYLDLLKNSEPSTDDLSLDHLNISAALELCKLIDFAKYASGVLLFVPHLMRAGGYTVALEHLRGAERSLTNAARETSLHAEVLAELGSVLFRLGDYASAEPILLAAIDTLPRHSPLLCGVYDDIGSLNEKRGDYERAEQFFSRGLRLAETGSDKARQASLLTQAGWLAISKGNYELAERRFSVARQCAADAKRDDLLSGVLNNWGWAKIKQGLFSAGDKLLNEGLKIAERINFQERIAALRINLGVSAEKQGSYVQAQSHYETALEIAERLGSPEKASAVLTNLGLLAEYRGSFQEAEDSYNRAFAMAKSMGHKERMSNLLQNLGSVAEYMGRFPEALEKNTEGLELARQIGHQERTAALLQERGSIFYNLGRMDESEAVLKEALQLGCVNK